MYKKRINMAMLAKWYLFWMCSYTEILRMGPFKMNPFMSTRREIVFYHANQNRRFFER